MAVVNAYLQKFTGVDTTTPIEGADFLTAGALAASTAVSFPVLTKTTSGGLGVARIGAVRPADATNPTSTWQAGWTSRQNNGQGAAPNLSKTYNGEATETAPVSAPGTVPAPTLTINKALDAYATRVAVVRPSVPGTPPVYVSSDAKRDSTGTVILAASSIASGHYIDASFVVDNNTVVINPPGTGGWTQVYRHDFAGGTLVGFARIAGAGEPGSQNYTFTWSIPTGAPVNTSLPAITGTPAVGSSLACSTGSWTNSPTSYAYQWRQDAVNITGATSFSYTVATIDAGHSLDCIVTATNTGGSASATAPSVSIPAPPTNTALPIITTDGSPATGEIVACDGGSWTGSPALTFQWNRDGGALGGQTAGSYTLIFADEGRQITCTVTATNGGGTASATSAAIVPAVTAPLSSSNIIIRYSGGAGNQDPNLSIGGTLGATYSGALSGLFPTISGSVALAGGDFYRVVYIRNTHTIASFSDIVAFIEAQFTFPGLELAVAVPTETANQAVSVLPSGTTPPSGVTWITATTVAGGGDFGDLAPSDYRGLYVRLRVTAGTARVPEADASFGLEGVPT